MLRGTVTHQLASMERIEGLAKLTGAERYVDDIPIEGGLWGMTVRSPAPRGRIREIRFGPAVDWSQFTIVDHRDIPGANEVLLIEPDQPLLAADRVRHVHEPIVLLAHPSRDAVRRAVRSVQASEPNGAPRSTERRSAANSASVCGACTCFVQSVGSGTGHGASNDRAASSPCARRHRLDHRQSAARVTRLARNAFRST